MSRIGLIGGSGIYEVKGFSLQKKRKITTPYGNPSDRYLIGRVGKTEIVFLPRHGSQHSIPPHMINYRANLFGFKKLGIERIISVSAVGGIAKGLRPGDLVAPDQIIDRTQQRTSTYYDGRDGVVHIDFTEPYCPDIRRILIAAGKKARVPLRKTGTYIAVDGPRLETAAEIRGFRRLGADVVGMTAMPEASLARELEICYAGICVVANYAAGINGKRLTVSEVMNTMRASIEKIKKLLLQTCSLIPDERHCGCSEALNDARI